MMLLALSRNPRRTFCTAQSLETVIVAIGSNLGNRAQTIANALDEINKFAKVRQTSFLYESPPMYKTDQPPFLNAVCDIETKQDPYSLLSALKQIEANLGRDVHGERNGPRPIDLDIITYGDRTIHSSHIPLVIPHERLSEREFVLRPLCDIDPTLRIAKQPGATLTASDLLRNLLERDGECGLVRVTPTSTGRLLRWTGRTHLMGIINATPDSFSDGGKHDTVSAALRQAETFSTFDFDIIDIGGQSTRPGAQPVSVEEETRRVVPITAALHAAFPHMLISADTFRAPVARAMIASGAEMINDVSGGALDPHMVDTMKATRAAAVLMHMRGTPATMQSHTTYDALNIASAVADELQPRLREAQRAGIPRWSLLSDCGIGFAKSAAQSAALLGSQAAFRARAGAFPTVLGASRKSWLAGHARADGRDWATAGAVAAAVAEGGVDVVRVHRAEVADAVRAAEGVSFAGRRCAR